MYSASPKAKRVEFRPPDPAANPYLAFAAMLMAGLDGILNKVDPGEPLDKDIYDLSPEEMKSVPSMPGSLDEALGCLEDDHAFLLRGDRLAELGQDHRGDRLWLPGGPEMHVEHQVRPAVDPPGPRRPSGRRRRRPRCHR